MVRKAFASKRVGGAAGVGLDETRRVAVGDGRGLRRQRLQGVGAEEIRTIIFRGFVGVEHAKELQSGLYGSREHLCFRCIDGAHASAFDERLEREAGGIVFRRRRTCGELAEVSAREHGARRTNAGLDRSARVFGLELADLPLAGHHPERVEDTRAGAGTNVGVGRLRLEPGPTRDRCRARHVREGRLGGGIGESRRVVSIDCYDFLNRGDSAEWIGGADLNQGVADGERDDRLPFRPIADERRGGDDCAGADLTGDLLNGVRRDVAVHRRDLGGCARECERIWNVRFDFRGLNRVEGDGGQGVLEGDVDLRRAIDREERPDLIVRGDADRERLTGVDTVRHRRLENDEARAVGHGGRADDHTADEELRGDGGVGRERRVQRAAEDQASSDD